MSHFVKKSVWVFVLALAIAAIAAPVSAQGVLFVENDRVGIGEATPDQLLHLRGNGARILVEDDTAGFGERILYSLTNNGPIRFSMASTTGLSWSFKTQGPVSENFDISLDGSGVSEMRIFSGTGDVEIQGDIITGSCPAGCQPDFVFEPEYQLMPLQDVGEFVRANKHLPGVTPASDGPMPLTERTMEILAKVEELTLYVLAQQEQIQDQQEQIQNLQAKLQAQ